MQPPEGWDLGTRIEECPCGGTCCQWGLGVFWGDRLPEALQSLHSSFTSATLIPGNPWALSTSYPIAPQPRLGSGGWAAFPDTNNTTLEGGAGFGHASEVGVPCPRAKQLTVSIDKKWVS